MELQKNLLALRHKMNLSQDALADKVGVSRQTVSRWEVGDVTPTADNLLALSTLYGVPAEELMDERIENILKKLEERKISAQKAEEDTPAEEAAQTEPPPPNVARKPRRIHIFLIALLGFYAVMLVWGKLTRSMGVAKVFIVYATFLLILAGLAYALYTLILYLKKEIKK